MKTQTQASAWLNGSIGQHLDYDQQYGQQCFDFFNFYYQWLSGDSPYADGFGVSGAKDIWGVPTTVFDKIPDSSALVPMPGDVLIYGASWGAGYGHVEICLASDAFGAHLVGENEHNDPTEGVIEVYRTWAQMSGLIGVLRPHWQAEPTYITLDQLDQLYQSLLGRQPDQGGIDHYVSHYSYEFTRDDLLASTEYKLRQAELAAKNSVLPIAPVAEPPAVTPPKPKPASAPPKSAIAAKPSQTAAQPWGQWNWLYRMLKRLSLVK